MQRRASGPPLTPARLAANDAVLRAPLTPESVNADDARALWLTVLWQGLLDAAPGVIRRGDWSGSHGVAGAMNRLRAVEWLSSKDFREVCELAGVDPDWVFDNRDALIKQLGRQKPFCKKKEADHDDV